MRLSELQSGFRSWLEDSNEHFAARLGRRARHGLDVYQNNYRAQLQACLQGAFPITREWIGLGAFHDAAVQHISSHHPTSWTLDAYPGSFDRTLKELFSADPEVPELANLEWTLSQAFISQDAVPLGAEQLVDIDWDRAVLQFAPSVMTHDLQTNAPEIWSALKQGTPPPIPVVTAQQRALVVWRTGERCQFRIMDRHEQVALHSARVGSTFGELCGKLASTQGAENASISLGQWLGRWISDGLIVGIGH